MKMKNIFVISILLSSFIGYSANAKICNSPQGNITSIIPSAGVTGFKMDVAIGGEGCMCEAGYIWIDTASESGKVMYSAALAAKMAKQPVLATFEDGNGQGAAGNTSITYRYWATCKLKALEVL
jgi:hypothetical protein